MSTLFEPITLRRRLMKNRLAKTATFEGRGTPDGYVTDEYVSWYRDLAQGGVGLIHTGIAYVSEPGKAAPHQVGIERDDRIPGFCALAEAVHEHDCLVLAQLHHPGRQLMLVPGFNDGCEVVAPSAVKHLLTRVTPRPFTLAEIADLVARFGDAAHRAELAGLDGVQIHVAHGYLLNAFLSRRTNRRTDRYGGSLHGRLRIIREIVETVRERTRTGFLITVKLSGYDGPYPGDLSAAEAAEVASAIGSWDVDAIEVSTGTYEYPRTTCGTLPLELMFTVGLGRYLPGYVRAIARLLAPLAAYPLRYREGFNMSMVRRIRRATDVPIIALGGFKTPEAMEAVLDRGEADIIALGRQLIADPDFPEKVRTGRKFEECSFCNKCIALVGAKPAMCYERHDYHAAASPQSGAIRELVGV
ncbi:MAG: NADH:flavin oxidoreductase [Candidatus Schekmanbacteria bacterium]|nr:NADH:flavin oxidoreductase [Candidatus Schekmanbacteria bacterium]